MREAIEFEKKYGSGEFVKAIITTLNTILIKNGVTTADELKSEFLKEMKKKRRN